MDSNTNAVLTVQAAKPPKKPLKQRLSESGCFSPFYLTVMICFATSLTVYILSRLIQPVAEFISRYPSQGIRFLVSGITSFIPFSVAECILILIPLFIVCYIIYAVRRIKRNDEHFVSRVIMPLVSIILIIATLFFSMFAPSYFRNPLSKNLGIEDAAVTGQELYDTAVWLSKQIDEVIPSVTFSPTGESHMPFSYSVMTELINDAFSNYASSVDYITSFKSSPKAIALSEPMMYTHISGVYSFFTGEANVNVHYPDFIIPYTMAHEMSHQRGIAREEEANMVAFLVCLSSDNGYIRYSGLMNVLSYVTSALYKADKKLYQTFRSYYYPSHAASEMSAYSTFFEKYRDSVANKVTSSVNNSFLQSQGQSQGAKSYGLVVDLTVSYYKSLSAS